MEIAIKGSAAELAAHYRSAYKKLTCIAAGVLGQLDDAEDIVQQAVTIAIDKNEQFQTGNHFIAWLCSTVRLCAMNHRRKLAGRKTIASDPAVMSVLLDDSKTNHESEPIIPGTGQILPDQQSFDDQMMRALKSLSPEARSCLLLRVIENLSYMDIAELMQIPEGTAMSHVHRGKSKLREMLMPARQTKGGKA